MGLFDFFNKKKIERERQDQLRLQQEAEAKRRANEQRSQDEAHKNVMSLLEEIIGTEDKPAKVEKQKLADGSIYTGEAILCKDGSYLPYGWGKKYVSKELELTGSWRDGNINGVCYMTCTTQWLLVILLIADLMAGVLA